MNHLTSDQLDRLAALARIVNDAAPHFKSYHGDLVYDGALLATNDGPCAALIRDMGSEVFFTRERAQAALAVQGEEEGRAHWHLLHEDNSGVWGYKKVWFERVSAAEAIAALPYEKG